MSRLFQLFCAAVFAANVAAAVSGGPAAPFNAFMAAMLLYCLVRDLVE